MVNPKSGLDPQILTRIKQELFNELQSIFFSLDMASQPDPAFAKFLALPRDERLVVFRQALAELAREFTPMDSDESDEEE